jgi:cold shock CspA family protein
MQTPTEIAFQHCEPSEAIHAEIDRQTQRLEKFSSRITSCHIVVTKLAARHKQGDLFRIDLRIAMPGRDVIIDRSHGDAPEHEHATVAIRDAFDAAIRQIEDDVRELRDEVKQHAAAEHGRVARFLAGEDCGFIETADGRDIYFHRNSVLDGDFDRLVVGSEVRFAEELGEKGAQASTVRMIGKHHLD